MEQLNIAGKNIGGGSAPYIIAEIGANHNGDMALCRQMIDAARNCGVDAVKFQSWSKDSLISKAEYRRSVQYSTGGNDGTLTLQQQVERYQLTEKQHRETADYCRATGIVFFSSCFSKREVDLLTELDVPAFKIASMDVNNLPLLEYVATKRRPVILSTGLATLGEVEAALNALGDVPVALLHCVSIYPSPPEIVNLRNIQTLKTCFGVPVGYSDHSLGTAIPLASVALGAQMIEKHFTLDKGLEGWDHNISSDPAEMTVLVRESRAVFESLGSPLRNINRAQIEKRKTFRRRMVLVRPLNAGDKIGPDDVDFKRPGTGIGPEEMKYVVGRTICRNVEAEEEVEWQDLA